MKRQYGLFCQLTRFDNLLLAARKAARGKHDRLAVAEFEFYLEREVLALQSELKEGCYKPGEFFTFEIRDPKPRRICAAPFRDRVVHHAICNVLAPVFERRLIFDSYACRPGKGSHAAVKRVQEISRRYAFFLKLDIRKYFDSVDHSVLKSLLKRYLKDRPLLELLERIIDNSSPWTGPGKGLPIGNLTSQYFANIYLGELDHFLKERHETKGYIRYMDDMLVFASNKPELHELLVLIRQFLDQKLCLQLKTSALLLAPVTQGVPYLGFRIWPGLLRVDKRSLRRLRRRLRSVENAYSNNRMDIDRLGNSVASMFAHVANADTLHLRRKVINDSLHLG